jgi:hypothetical protein
MYRAEQQRYLDKKSPELRAERLMEQMKKDLYLSEQPRHIECFDNSNIQGSYPVAACVVFRDGRPARSEYRHFNVKTVVGADDFATMREIIGRRYGRLLKEGAELPQLVVIDGGKGQLSAVYEVFEELGLTGRVALIGLAKRLEEIFFPQDSVPYYLDKNSETLKVLMHIPGINNLILSKVRKQLINAFGGKLEMIVLGGAALNGEIEDLLRRMRFPYTVGYGMTECAPLIAYAPWYEIRKASCGKIVDRMESRIVPLHEGDEVGELWVRGTNTMLGYYKNQEATDSTFKDGWMNTGDLCVFDKDGFIYIKGRNKNLILGPSGQNIYPEEIEEKINNMPYVAESLVVDRKGQLVALIYPDFEKGKQDGLSAEEVKKIVVENRNELNKQLPAYSRIIEIELREEEFEKTPKRSIRRFMYK